MDIDNDLFPPLTKYSRAALAQLAQDVCNTCNDPESIHYITANALLRYEQTVREYESDTGSGEYELTECDDKEFDYKYRINFQWFYWRDWTVGIELGCLGLWIKFGPILSIIISKEREYRD